MLSRSFLASIGNGAVGGLSGVEWQRLYQLGVRLIGGSRKRRDHLKPGPRLDPTRRLKTTTTIASMPQDHRKPPCPRSGRGSWSSS